MMRPYPDEVAKTVFNDFYFFDKNFNEKIEAAENGNVDMMEQVGLAYLNGQDGFEEVDADPVKAAYWMEKAAKNGSRTAIFNIALFYAKGFGVKRDFEKAADWMKKAVKDGNQDAVGAEMQYREAAEAYKKAVAGDPQGQSDYASNLMLLANSLDQAGSDADYKEAIEWALKAEGKDDGQADFVLVLAYEHGRGVSINYKKAAKYYKKGSKKEHMICINNLGRLYFLGEGLPKDLEKAFSLFLKSA